MISLIEDIKIWIEGLSNQALGILGMFIVGAILSLVGWAAYEWTPRRRIRRLK